MLSSNEYLVSKIKEFDEPTALDLLEYALLTLILDRDWNILDDLIDNINILLNYSSVVETIKTYVCLPRVRSKLQNVDKFLIRILDSCFCDDYDQPECSECTENRKLLSK